ncbi:MAG: hypothetical protein KGH63_04365 [Candidatus Micrarchaeota archaeon]|nr:hypothetical protein [Candidatus Micrarchaeota archaeon]
MTLPNPADIKIRPPKEPRTLPTLLVHRKHPAPAQGGAFGAPTANRPTLPPKAPANGPFTRSGSVPLDRRINTLPGTPSGRHLPKFDSVYAPAFQAYKERFGTPSSVLYPCCGNRAIPPAIFANVVYLDRDIGQVKVLKEMGLLASALPLKAYHPPRPHELLILISPKIPVEMATPHLEVGGYAICDNAQGTAAQLRSRPRQFKLIASINLQAGAAVLSKNVSGLLQRHADYQELKQQHPDSAFLALYPTPESFEQARQFIGEQLPYRREADLYVFRKISKEN